MTEFHDDQYWGHVPHVPMYHQGHRHDHIPVLSNVGDDEHYDAVVFSDMGEGPKGEKGDPTYFDDLTDEDLAKIYRQASFVGNKSQDAIVTTSGDSTTVITIPFDYDEFDILFVDVNGLNLAEGDDYSIVGNTISLVTPLPAGQKVHFRALKYQLVDGDKTIQITDNRKDYNTIAEMQADDTLKPGDICHTIGFHAAGDGGAAWYKITSHAVANGMDILALENGCFAELQITGSYITPEIFGAWGDGTHDDVDAIQSAIDYLDGGTVKLLAMKTYICSSPIVLHRGICLQGSAPYDGMDRGSVIKLADNSNCPLIQTPLSSGTGVATHFMMLENLTLDGNKSNQTTEANLVEFYGAYIGSIIRNVHISNFYGSGLIIREADIQLDNIWIIGGATDSDRYAMDMNPGLSESTRTSMINTNNLYIEQYANKKFGDTINNQADRGNALHVYKCAIFNANEIHFEGCNVPVTIENSWNILINNCSVGPSGNSSDEDLGIIDCKTDFRLLSINGLMRTDGYCYYKYWIKNNSTSNVFESIPIKSGYYAFPFYMAQSNALAEKPVIFSPEMTGDARVKKIGNSSTSGFYIVMDENIYSGVRCNGNYYTEIGSRSHQNSFKPFIRFDSYGSNSDAVRVFDPFVLGTRDGAGAVSAGSIYVYNASTGKRPVYQKTTGVQDDMNTVGTMRIRTFPPNNSASYLGEMYWDMQQKHLYISHGVGNGASDWSQIF